MLLTKILFVLLIAICAAFYILYVWDFALVLLVVMIALPVVMFVLAFVAKKTITVEFAASDETFSKNTSFPVQLCIENRSVLPIGKAEARIEYYNVFSNQITAFELFIPIQARNAQRVTFQLSSQYCGIVNVKCAYINIFDPLRIFRFKVGKNASAKIAVAPEYREIDGVVTYTDRTDDESEVFSENAPGDDPSEVFDLREYIPGDKLNRIHWKLSSKKDDFIVKDYSLPIDSPTTLFLNLKCYEDSENTLPVFDTLVETLISISQFLLDNERAHNVVYYSGKYKRFLETTISEPEELADLARDIVLSIDDSLYAKPPEDYFTVAPSVYSSFVFVTSRPKTQILEYVASSIDADIKNAVVVVASAEEIAKVNSDDPNLNIIPVVAGRISSSIKDIEL